VRYLEEMGMKAKAASTALFHHDQQTAAVMVEIIKEMRRLGGICEWESEVDSEGRDRKRFAPDATGKVTDQHGRRFVFFLETDMGTETNITFGKKVINYERYYKVGNWQATLERKNFPVVLVVTSSSSRRRDMEKRIKGLMQAVATQRKVDDNQIAWYFTSTERLARYVGVVNGDGRGPLQAPVWSRDGQEALEGIM